MTHVPTGRPTPAMTNAERQRQFRERNPGYYARIQASRRASAKRGGEQPRRLVIEQAERVVAAAATPWPTADAAVSVLFDMHSV